MEKEQLIALVSALQQGEADAATELYNAFHQDLYYHIFKTVNDPTLAEDLLQDTFMEIFEKIDQLHEPVAFVTWSRQIAYHKCTSYFRKRRELLVDEQEDGYTVFDTIEEDRTEFIPDEALDKEDLKQTIHAMIAQLPPEQRSALLMRYFDEISVKEIAEIQGVSEGTVKSRLNYGRKAIKQAVEDYEKKNDVKLHCAGVIPLLLWLFREYAVANSISLTATTASVAYTAAGASAATAVAGGVAAAEGVAATEGVVATGIKAISAKIASLKAAGTLAAKQVVAGVAAAAVLTTGAVVGVIAALPKEEEKIMQWYGYGSTPMAFSEGTRYDMEIEQMDETQISGTLVRSKRYAIQHETHFTGTGVKVDEKIEYSVVFETPTVMGTIPTFEYSEIKIIYDPATDSFLMKDFYRAELVHISTLDKTPLLEDVTFSGAGMDIIEGYSHYYDHYFELHIDHMSKAEIRGTVTVSHKDAQDHAFEFSGRGYYDDEKLCYEIRMDKSLTERELTDYDRLTFRLSFDSSLSYINMVQSLYSVMMYREDFS